MMQSSITGAQSLMLLPEIWGQTDCVGAKSAIFLSIFARRIDRGRLSLTHSFRVNPQIQDCEVWPQKTRNIVLWCIAYSDIMNHSGLTHKCDKLMDRQTDF